MFNIFIKKTRIKPPSLIFLTLCLSLFLPFSSSLCSAKPSNLHSEGAFEFVSKEPTSLMGIRHVSSDSETFFSTNGESLFSFDMLFGLSLLVWLLYLWFSQKTSFALLAGAGPLPWTKSGIKLKSWKQLLRRFFMLHSSSPEVYRIYRNLRF